MRVATQFSIYLVNKPGVLATVTTALSEAGVNILALALMDSGEHGALRIVCDEAEKARAALEEVHNRWTECDVLLVKLDNKPGTFAEITRKLSENHINITYAYFSGTLADGRIAAVFRLSDLNRAAQIFAD